ncbi:MAG: hypothetical protein OJJ21_05225 [Ferrovibrio sp.]|uniref:hypothetical protein n=1 Tax=Ferrovibrio sp. TaxID=1917215 RepID=UPI002611297D|nr:hypothetical protein [Ferrovibrio sp.]MCW0232983.1 hypothetical protein [Ferrovibrio sp.]
MSDHDDPDAGARSRPKSHGKAEDRAARTARLAERLRANLGRRKQQARARRRTGAAPDGAADPQEPEPKA